MSWEEWRPARRTTMAPPSSLHSRTAPGPTPRRRRTAAGTDTWPCAVSFEWAIGDMNINYHGNVRQSTSRFGDSSRPCRSSLRRPTLGVAPAQAPRPALSRSSNAGRSAAAGLGDDLCHEEIGLRTGGLVERRSGAGQIRPCEVLADVEEWLARESGDGVGEAVAEVQGRGMPALAEPGVRVDRDRPVLGGEGDDRNARLLHDPGEKAPPAWAQLRCQDQPGLGQGRSPGAGVACRELVDERFPARLPENDRDERRRVDDHMPCGPNRRIRSRSRLLVLRPSVLRGTWGHTSVSRKRTKSA